MTLRGDRVTRDWCGRSRPASLVEHGLLKRIWRNIRARGWVMFAHRLALVKHACPACRAAHTDDELRALLARQEAKA